MAYKLTLFLFLVGPFFVLSRGIEFYYAIDSNSSHRIDNLADLHWKSYSPGNAINMGYNINSTIWCKLEYDVLAIGNKTIWIFDNIHLDSISVYFRNKPWSVLGDRTRNHSAFFNIQAIPLPSIQDTERVVLFAAVKKQWTHIDFQMDLANSEVLQKNSNSELALSFTFLGFAILWLILIAYLFLKTKKKWYWHYLVYSVAGIIYVFTNMGILRDFVFPGFLYFSEIRIYSSCYWFLLMGAFLSHTIQHALISPVNYRIFTANQYVILGLSFLTIFLLFTGHFQLLSAATKAIYVLFLMNIIGFIVALIKALKLKQPMAFYVFFSFIPHIAWGLYIVFHAAGLFPFPLSLGNINLVIMYEMAFFGWLIIKDYIEAFRKNKMLQEKILADEKETLHFIELARIKERRQVSELLHDKIGVDIARTIHSLELGNGLVAKSYLAELGRDIRNLSHTILPRELEDGAFVSALESQAQIINSQLLQTKLSFEEFDFPNLINKNMAFSLYLITMELIQNAMKHAQANSIRIECYGHPDELVISITDDGIGFDTSKELGFGLKNITRRINEFGGSFSLNSSAEFGTTAMLIVPY